jgi:predicted Ser/Thr protein kinase
MKGMNSGSIHDIGRRVSERFAEDRRLLTFSQLHELFEFDPYVVARNATQYLRDAIDHFGSYQVDGIGGKTVRWRIFDPDPEEPGSGVVGHEAAQQSIVDSVVAGAREGRMHRMMVLHGPNGSGKSSLIECLQRGLESYSHTTEGAFYALRWIFPKLEPEGASLGFGGRRRTAMPDSYALLEPEDVAGRAVCEFRDNPLFVIPDSERPSVLEAVLERNPERRAQSFTHFLRGNLCPKCKQIYEGLLASYKGDWTKLVRHVQVERVFISRRFRMGAVVTQPQGTADAQIRVFASDALIANLPPVLQTRNLYEVTGDLPDANRGLLEFSDFLKRNLELSKYLLQTTEKGFVSVGNQLLELDIVFAATANEVQLAAFKQLPEFAAFEGRMSFVRVPYLLEFPKETSIYEQICAEVERSRHVAPHVPRAAALFAVLTRLTRPQSDRFEGSRREVLQDLSPLEKAWLYARGQAPARLSPTQARELRLALPDLRSEYDGQMIYEGCTGASVREMRAVLLRAAEGDGATCLTPRALADGIEQMLKETTLHRFLQLEPDHAYHDTAKLLQLTRKEVAGWVRSDLEDSMELVADEEYDRRFESYFQHLVAHTMGESVSDPASGGPVPPSMPLLESVEAVFPIQGDVEEFRRGLVSRIGAHALDHPDEGRPDFRTLFPDLLRALRRDVFEQRREQVDQVQRHVLLAGTPDFEGLSAEEQELAKRTVANLEERHGYKECCLRMSIGFAMEYYEARDA